MNTKVKPRVAYPHTKRVGDFIFVSGTSSRRADNSIAGVDLIDEMGTKHLTIETQTREVLQNINTNLINQGFHFLVNNVLPGFTETER